MATRIACAGISGRIIQGRVNKAGDAFTGQTKDVTSDVLKAMIDKLEHHGGSVEITENGKVVAEISLNRRAIPVDLLERCAERLEYHMCSECKEATCCMPGTRAAAVELRALLGNDMDG